MKKGNRTGVHKNSFMQITFWLCFLLFFGCSTEPDGKRVEEIRPDANNSIKDIIRNPVSADTPMDTINVAKLKFDQKSIDFGEVKEGKEVKEVFTFTNTGTVPLLINSAKSTCGCTVPDWPKTPIAPGEKGEIQVKFDTDGKPNYQSKPITVYANTYPNKTVVYLKGKVTPKAK